MPRDPKDNDRSKSTTRGKTVRPSATLDLKAKEVKQNAGDEPKTTKTDKPAPSLSDDAAQKTSQTRAASAPLGARKSKKSRSEDASSTQIGSALTHAAAGIVGGLIALLTAAYGLNWTNSGGPFSKTEQQQLENRLAGIEKGLKESASREGNTVNDAAIKDIVSTLETLKTAQSALTQSQSALTTRTDKIEATLDQQPTITKDVAARLNEIEKSLENRTVTDTGEANPNWIAVTKKADLVENQVNELATKFTTKIHGLEDQLSALKSSREMSAPVSSPVEVESLKKAVKTSTAQLGEDLIKVRTQTSKLDQDLSVLKSQAQRTTSSLTTVLGDTEQLSQTVDRLKSQIKSIESKTSEDGPAMREIKGLTSKLAGLEENLKAVLARQNLVKESAKNTGLSIALNNLKSAIDRGDPFENELHAVQRLSTNIKLASLEVHAATGVKTEAALEKSFKDTIRKVFDAEQAPSEGTVFGKLMANAKSAIRIRRTGDVKGSTTEAVIARMEQRMKEGNLSAALKEGQGLKDLAREAADPWLKHVQARLTTKAALQATETEIMANLSGAKTPGKE